MQEDHGKKDKIDVDELEKRQSDELASLIPAINPGLLAMADYTAATTVAAELSSAPLKAKGTEAELTPKQVECLGELKCDFDELTVLHPNIEWADVEKSLIADKKAIMEFEVLNAKGHKMTVFGLNEGKFIFASAWTDIAKVAPDHRNVVFDPAAEAWLAEHYPAEKCNGNVISKIMDIMGVEEDKARNYLASGKLHKHLIKAIKATDWAYLQTDDVTRNHLRKNHNSKDNYPGLAFLGNFHIVFEFLATSHDVNGSFRVMREVLKVA